MLTFVEPSDPLMQGVPSPTQVWICLLYTSTDPDVWYHMGIASAEDFDRYADWHKFVANLISSDGGGLLAVYVGDEEFSTTCTPGTEYVIYGFAYDDSEVRSEDVYKRQT